MVPESDEEDEDWTKYADAGYASAYDPWADLVEVEESTDEDEDFDEDFSVRLCVVFVALFFKKNWRFF